MGREIHKRGTEGGKGKRERGVGRKGKEASTAHFTPGTATSP